MVLRNVPVIEICDAQVEKDIEQKGKIKKVKIETVLHHASDDLDISVDGENPNWFDQKIQCKQQSEVCQKFSLHIKKVKSFRGQKLFR